MGNNHNHHHGNNYNRSFAIGVLLNIIFVVIEAVFGVLSGSLALLGDAGHNLSDVVSLLLAWGANLLASKAVSDNRTYGFRKATVFAALGSAILLLAALGSIAWEAISRFNQPPPIESTTIIIVAAIGVVINALTAMLFFKGQQHDLNIRGAFLHMAADAAISLGVVIAGIIISIKGWLWIDPVVSLVIVFVILVGTWGLLRDSVNYAIDAVPNKINVAEIKKYLLNFKGVVSLHDIHVWPLSTTDVAMTVHIVVRDPVVDNKFLWELQQHLHDHFGIEHTTIQIETLTNDHACMQDCQ